MCSRFCTNTVDSLPPFTVTTVTTTNDLLTYSSLSTKHTNVITETTTNSESFDTTDEAEQSFTTTDIYTIIGSSVPTKMFKGDYLHDFVENYTLADENLVTTVTSPSKSYGDSTYVYDRLSTVKNIEQATSENNFQTSTIPNLTTGNDNDYYLVENSTQFETSETTTVSYSEYAEIITTDDGAENTIMSITTTNTNDGLRTSVTESTFTLDDNTDQSVQVTENVTNPQRDINNTQTTTALLEYLTETNTRTFNTDTSIFMSDRMTPDNKKENVPFNFDDIDKSADEITSIKYQNEPTTMSENTRIGTTTDIPEITMTNTFKSKDGETTTVFKNALNLETIYFDEERNDNANVTTHSYIETKYTVHSHSDDNSTERLGSKTFDTTTVSYDNTASTDIASFSVTTTSNEFPVTFVVPTTKNPEDTNLKIENDYSTMDSVGARETTTSEFTTNWNNQNNRASTTPPSLTVDETTTVIEKFQYTIRNPIPSVTMVEDNMKVSTLSSLDNSDSEDIIPTTIGYESVKAAINSEETIPINYIFTTNKNVEFDEKTIPDSVIYYNHPTEENTRQFITTDNNNIIEPITVTAPNQVTNNIVNDPFNSTEIDYMVTSLPELTTKKAESTIMSSINDSNVSQGVRNKWETLVGTPESANISVGERPTINPPEETTPLSNTERTTEAIISKEFSTENYAVITNGFTNNYVANGEGYNYLTTARGKNESIVTSTHVSDRDDTISVNEISTMANEITVGSDFETSNEFAIISTTQIIIQGDQTDKTQAAGDDQTTEPFTTLNSVDFIETKTTNMPPTDAESSTFNVIKFKDLNIQSENKNKYLDEVSLISGDVTTKSEFDKKNYLTTISIQINKDQTNTNKVDDDQTTEQFTTISNILRTTDTPLDIEMSTFKIIKITNPDLNILNKKITLEETSTINNEVIAETDFEINNDLTTISTRDINRNQTDKTKDNVDQTTNVFTTFDSEIILETTRNTSANIESSTRKIIQTTDTTFKSENKNISPDEISTVINGITTETKIEFSTISTKINGDQTDTIKVDNDQTTLHFTTFNSIDEYETTKNSPIDIGSSTFKIVSTENPNAITGNNKIPLDELSINAIEMTTDSDFESNNEFTTISKQINRDQTEVNKINDDLTTELFMTFNSVDNIETKTIIPVKSSTFENIKTIITNINPKNKNIYSEELSTVANEITTISNFETQNEFTTISTEINREQPKINKVDDDQTTEQFTTFSPINNIVTTTNKRAEISNYKIIEITADTTDKYEDTNITQDEMSTITNEITTRSDFKTKTEFTTIEQFTTFSSVIDNVEIINTPKNKTNSTITILKNTNSSITTENKNTYLDGVSTIKNDVTTEFEFETKNNFTTISPLINTDQTNIIYEITTDLPLDSESSTLKITKTTDPDLISENKNIPLDEMSTITNEITITSDFETKNEFTTTLIPNINRDQSNGIQYTEQFTTFNSIDLSTTDGTTVNVFTAADTDIKSVNQDDQETTTIRVLTMADWIKTKNSTPKELTDEIVTSINRFNSQTESNTHGDTMEIPRDHSTTLRNNIETSTAVTLADATTMINFFTTSIEILVSSLENDSTTTKKNMATIGLENENDWSTIFPNNLDTTLNPDNIISDDTTTITENEINTSEFDNNYAEQFTVEPTQNIKIDYQTDFPRDVKNVSKSESEMDTTTDLNNLFTTTEYTITSKTIEIEDVTERHPNHNQTNTLLSNNINPVRQNITTATRKWCWNDTDCDAGHKCLSAKCLPTGESRVNNCPPGIITLQCLKGIIYT